MMAVARPAWAMGKKSPTSPTAGTCTPSGDSGFTTPSPARKVVLGQVSTLPFTLPNASKTQIDLTADLQTLLNTAVAGTQSYFPSDPPSATDPCGSYLAISAAVSTLELNATQFGVTFGYSPSGATSTSGVSVSGSVTVNIGTIAMDFSIRQCNSSGCTTIGAVSTSAATAGVNTSFTVDFDSITATPSLVWNTDLGNILRGIMSDGAKKLVAAANPSLLSWSATVRAVSGSSLVFDAGTQALLGPNQTFAVYAVTPVTGACNVFEAVANVHTTQVEPISSTAAIDQQLDTRGVQVGDLVVIRPAN
jgi:hypothetical protein